MIDRLECGRCRQAQPADRLQNLCPCGGPLLARYDLDALAGSWRPEHLAGRRWDLWRYREVLPLPEGVEPLTLGEGGTPLLSSRRIGPRLGLSSLAFKDETGNPTGSFKARGLAVAVHRARALGARHIAIPSTGNAGVAAAAYSSAAGLSCTVAMPSDTPALMVAECRAYGATAVLIDGTIADAGDWLRAHTPRDGWFSVSTLREPYRLEGKKTMGFELAEQAAWVLPDAIVYPTGGGTGLIGMWKAFDEMEALGWLGSERPKMIAVQATGCAPIVHAFESGAVSAPAVADPCTVASGLCVPAALGDFLILGILRASNGAAVAVTDEALIEGARQLARQEGILAGPEAGATVAALPELMKRGMIGPDDRVVCFLTGGGLKYPVLHMPSA